MVGASGQEMAVVRKGGKEAVANERAMCEEVAVVSHLHRKVRVSTFRFAILRCRWDNRG
jgi:hypothetical protein